jgi:hypothetical protein
LRLRWRLILINLRARIARSRGHTPTLGLFIEVGERVEAFIELISVVFRGLFLSDELKG